MIEQRAVTDVDLDRRVQGTGRTVVLVHGSASDRRTWRKQMGPLAERFRTVSYSRRYHWPNPPISPDADYEIEEHVADLRRLLEHLDEQAAHLVGHSYGAVVCLQLAMDRPDLVRRLVLIEPPVMSLLVSDPPTPGELARLAATRPDTALALLRVGAFGIEPARRAAGRGDMERALRRFGRAVLGRRTLARLSTERWEQALANNIRAEYVRGSLPALSADDVRHVTAPTLLVTGGRSPALFPRIAQHLGELLPDSRTAEVAGASHLVHEDRPRDFHRVLVRFLEGAA